MSRSLHDRLTDILTAVERTLAYRQHLTSEDPALAAMASDAVLRNLAVIGEAARHLPEQARIIAPEAPWASIAGLRNVVVHEYLRVDPLLIDDILDNELVPLARTVRAFLDTRA